ncbi:hypothetical protein [Reichenbachiella ulvae]|uniref:Uncharacterized protein n=1 Tax=Reichenbachiella ulvae TaxID=2980104 RepID=A0ABT3CTM2_9BACT|nr:hypothetical protein [Reichenbachiella ulvae]MCV9387042.1 hypothetical protein [Reichenbachiella ulvae]
MSWTIRISTFITLIALSFCTLPLIDNGQENEANFKGFFLKLKSPPNELEHIIGTGNPEEYCKHNRTLATNFLDLKYSTYSIADSCSACWDFKLLRVYNDSISIIMPFWDNFYYWKNAHSHRNNTSTNYLENLSFESNIRQLVLTLSNNNNLLLTTREVIQSIMHLDGMTQFSGPEICIIESFYKLHASDTYLSTDECKTALLSSIEELKEIIDLQDPNILIFRKDFLIYIFTITNNNKVLDLKVLNHECKLDVFM